MKINFKEINNFIFDIDRTIANPEIYSMIHKEVMNELGGVVYKFDSNFLNELEEIVRGNYKGDPMHWKVTYDICERLNNFQTDTIVLYWEKVESIVPIYSRLEPFTKEVFSLLRHKNKRIGIASSSQRRIIDLRFEKYGLEADFIWSFEDGGKKRFIEYWEKLTERYKLVANSSVVIGDELEKDIKNPKSLGYKTILVGERSDYGEEAKNADMHVQDMKGLYYTLKGLMV